MFSAVDQAKRSRTKALAFLLFFGLCFRYAHPLPRMESLHLKRSLGTQSISDGFVTDQDGTVFSLSELKPYTDLFPPTSNSEWTAYGAGADGTVQQSEGQFAIPVYRGTFRGGETIVQLQKDEDGNVVYVEIRNPNGKPDTFFVKTEECREDELLVFSEDDVDDILMNDFESVDELVVQDDGIIDENSNDIGRESLRGSIARLDVPPFVYERGDGTSSECTYFKVVKVGIIFDSDFCSKFGSVGEARGRISMIVASASIYYEQDMCVKLRITNIYTPDRNCDVGKSVFSTFPREKACGSSSTDSFLKSFRDWMNRNRGSLGLDPDAIFHAFTGFKPSGTLGCAYVGVYCRHRQHAYGVGYMTSDSLQTQSVIFAHEIAHNLNAPHLSSNADDDGKKYLMAPALQVRNDGFSQGTVDKVLGHLDSSDVICDEIEFPPSPTNPPTISPTKIPTVRPTPQPSMYPTFPSPSTLPSQIPSRTPVDPPQSSRDIPCRVQQVDQTPICVEESRHDGMYACYRPADLMSIYPTPSCDLNGNPFFVTMIPFLCEESRRNNRSDNDDNSNDRKLRGRNQPNSDDHSDGDIENDGLTTERNWEDIYLDSEVNVEKYGAKMDFFANGSDNPPLSSFDSRDCDVGCTIKGGFICFSASVSDREYRITFSAIHSFGTSFLSRDVTIRKNSDTNEDSNDNSMIGQPSSPSCDYAVTTCNKL